MGAIERDEETDVHMATRSKRLKKGGDARDGGVRDRVLAQQDGVHNGSSSVMDGGGL